MKKRFAGRGALGVMAILGGCIFFCAQPVSAQWFKGKDDEALSFDPKLPWFTDADRQLARAVGAGDLAGVDAALKNGAKINKRSWGNATQLMVASADWDNVQLVQLLLQRGADPLMKSIDGTTALALAIQKKRTHIIPVLRQWTEEAEREDRARRVQQAIVLKMEVKPDHWEVKEGGKETITFNATVGNPTNKAENVLIYHFPRIEFHNDKGNFYMGGIVNMPRTMFESSNLRVGPRGEAKFSFTGELKQENGKYQLSIMEDKANLFSFVELPAGKYRTVFTLNGADDWVPTNLDLRKYWEGKATTERWVVIGP